MAEKFMEEPVVDEAAAEAGKTDKPAKKATRKKKTRTVTGGALNVREKPSLKAKVVRVLDNGTKITVQEDLGEWLRIEDGYVMARWTE